ncbi:MAG: hypothetical protein NWE82_01275 [Candidatus Bathyarchaeota archaeon]|nr:hypothetical protein [Candidatus Bathyarchaeota archaeon]
MILVDDGASFVSVASEIVETFFDEGMRENTIVGESGNLVDRYRTENQGDRRLISGDCDGVEFDGAPSAPGH